MQTDRNSVCGDVVLDGVNICCLGMMTAFYNKYRKSKYVRIFIIHYTLDMHFLHKMVKIQILNIVGLKCCLNP